MAFLSSAELNDMRDHAEATLPTTCEIDYVTRTADGMGGFTQSWTARGTAIACRLTPARLGSHSDITADTLLEGQTWTLSVPYDQTVAVDDKVIVNSSTYRVSQVNTGESEILVKRAYVVRWE